MDIKTFFIGFACGAVFAVCIRTICKRAVSKQGGRADEPERRIADNAERAEHAVTEATERITELADTVRQNEQTTERSKEFNTRARELAKRSAEVLQETKRLLQDCKVYSSSVVDD